MKQPQQFLIEGVDRLGKSSLIKGLMNQLGYRLVIHYDKPQKLTFYKDEPLLSYQFETYVEMFRLISNGHRIIFDRAHLGEMVYAPMYRKYAGDYVLKLESGANTDSARLILLTTSDFSFIEDDGLSFDFAKKEEEQAKFITAFHASNIKDKVLIDVCNGKGGYKLPEEVLAEALKLTTTK